MHQTAEAKNPEKYITKNRHIWSLTKDGEALIDRLLEEGVSTHELPIHFFHKVYGLSTGSPEHHHAIIKGVQSAISSYFEGIQDRSTIEDYVAMNREYENLRAHAKDGQHKNL